MVDEVPLPGRWGAGRSGPGGRDGQRPRRKGPDPGPEPRSSGRGAVFLRTPPPSAGVRVAAGRDKIRPSGSRISPTTANRFSLSPTLPSARAALVLG